MGVLQVRGPITIVSGKKRRLTLIKVNNDLPSLIDAAKVCSFYFCPMPRVRTVGRW